MHLIIYKELPAAVHEFVEFWSGQYRYAQKDELYENNIRNPYSNAAIKDLFEWKNGSRLSKLKERSVQENFAGRMNEARLLGKDTDPKDFLRQFSKGGAIWRISWMHCWNQEFPIYDQHVHRAMTFIENRELGDLSTFSDDKKIDSYLERYIPFCRKFGTDRNTDRALWAFGKFIKARIAPDQSEDDKQIRSS